MIPFPAEWPVIPFPAEWPTTSNGLVAFLACVIFGMWWYAKGRQDEVDGKLTKIDKSAESLPAVIEAVKSEMFKVAAEIIALSGAVHRVEARVDSMAVDVHELRGEVGEERQGRLDLRRELRSDIAAVEAACASNEPDRDRA